MQGSRPLQCDRADMGGRRVLGLRQDQRRLNPRSRASSALATGQAAREEQADTRRLAGANRRPALRPTSAKRGRR